MCGIVRRDVVCASPRLETLSPVGHPICSPMAFYAKPRNHVLLLWDAVYSSDAGDMEWVALTPGLYSRATHRYFTDDKAPGRLRSKPHKGLWT